MCWSQKMYFWSLHYWTRISTHCLKSYRLIINFGETSFCNSSFAWRIVKSTMRWDQMDWIRYLSSFRIISRRISPVCSFTTKNPSRSKIISEGSFSNSLITLSITKIRKRTITIRETRKKIMRNWFLIWGLVENYSISPIWTKICKKSFLLSFSCFSGILSIPTSKTLFPTKICISIIFCFSC